MSSHSAPRQKIYRFNNFTVINIETFKTKSGVSFTKAFMWRSITSAKAIGAKPVHRNYTVIAWGKAAEALANCHEREVCDFMGFFDSNNGKNIQTVKLTFVRRSEDMVADNNKSISSALVSN